LSLNDHFSRGEIMFEDLPQYLRRNSTYDGQQAATSLELWRDGVPFLNEPLASVVPSGEFETPDMILNRGDAFFILLDQAFNTVAGVRGEIEMSARDFDDVDGQAQLVSMQGGDLRHVNVALVVCAHLVQPRFFLRVLHFSISSPFLRCMWNRGESLG
jgi:hypothetical protein